MVSTVAVQTRVLPGLMTHLHLSCELGRQSLFHKLLLQLWSPLVGGTWRPFTNHGEKEDLVGEDGKPNQKP